MIRVWAILFGLAVAIAGGMVVKAIFAKASAQFGRHIPARSQDDEAAVRISGLGQAWAGGDFIHLNLLPVLSAGSENLG